MVGYTRSLPMQGVGWHHSIALLSAMPCSELAAVYAHELAHAWTSKCVDPERRLGQFAEEGFCELVAHRVLAALNEEDAQARILRNNYTLGQVQLFVEADRAYGFQRIIDWMERGWILTS